MQRRDEILVHHLRLVVPLRLCLYLRQKTLVLIQRIVQFGKGVAHFAAIYKELETLRQTFVGGFFLGERADFNGIVVYEGGLHKVLFHQRVEALVQGVAPRALAFGKFHAQRTRRRHRLICAHFGKIHAGVLVHRLQHGKLFPFVEVYHHLAVGKLTRAQNGVGAIAEQPLRNVHHAVEVGVRLIQLYRGKLRIMFGIHTLVAELPAYFVHLFKPAHDKPFEVKLGGYAHVHVYVQRVVVSDKRAGVGASRYGVENGRFHFEKAALVKVLPDGFYYFGAQNEGALDVGIGDKIYVTLTVARFHVL